MATENEMAVLCVFISFLHYKYLPVVHLFRQKDHCPVGLPRPECL